MSLVAVAPPVQWYMPYQSSGFDGSRSGVVHVYGVIDAIPQSERASVSTVHDRLDARCWSETTRSLPAPLVTQPTSVTYRGTEPAPTASSCAPRWASIVRVATT